MDPVILLINSIFFVLFGVALWRWLLHRGPVELGVVAVFSTTAALFLLSFISAFTPGLVAIVRPVSYAALVAQPYLIIRLLDQIWPVPRWASWAALAGFLVVLAGLLGVGPGSLPVILALVAYFFVGESAAAIQFIRLAGRRRGVHRSRLTMAGIATGLFGLVIVIAGLGSAASNGSATAPPVLVASRLLALLAALGYLAAFVPPRWVMGFFHRAAAFDHARGVVAARPGDGPRVLWSQLAEAAEAILGATHVQILDMAGRPVELDRRAEAGGSSAAGSTATDSGLRPDRTGEITVPIVVDGRRAATLVARLEGRPLFVEDDIAIVTLLGSLTARAVRHGEDLVQLQATELALEQAAAIRASEARFRILLEADPNAILATDDAGRISWSTRSSEALFGYRAGELVGRELKSLVDIPTTDRAGVSDPERVAWVDAVAFKADGSALPVEVAVRHLQLEGKPTTVAIVADLSWRQEANAIRDRFIGILSHELRTPITAIYGGAQILMKRAGGLADDTRTDLLIGLAEESERLQRMIENLLILARVERGADFFGSRPVLVQRLLAEVIDRERTLWPGLTIRLDADASVPVVSGDEDQLAQVMRNLLSNAAKYAGDDAHVDVTIRYAAPWVSVTVRDDGPGFPPAEADQLFSLYYRSSGSRAATGAGIGLYVCRHLIGAMGGTVWARSVPDGGAEFGFTLAPYVDPEDEPDGRAPAAEPRQSVRAE